jgi:hypothetical protein
VEGDAMTSKWRESSANDIDTRPVFRHNTSMANKAIYNLNLKKGKAR